MSGGKHPWYRDRYENTRRHPERSEGSRNAWMFRDAQPACAGRHDEKIDATVVRGSFHSKTRII